MTFTYICSIIIKSIKEEAIHFSPYRIEKG
nr:MAG TPA: hypothetical protein [Caudoviricetes sp.]